MNFNVDVVWKYLRKTLCYIVILEALFLWELMFGGTVLDEQQPHRLWVEESNPSVDFVGLFFPR